MKRNIETFGAGVYDGDEEGEKWEYSDDDIAEIVKNFDLLSSGDKPIHKVPIAVRHDQIHSHGWVFSAKEKPHKDGAVLLTDWKRVSPGLREAIDKGSIAKVSAEIKENFADRTGKIIAPGKYLYRVVVLGADVPRVKGLEDIPATFADGKPGRRVERKFQFCGGGMHADDSGDSTMDRAAAITVLTDAGMDPTLITDQIPDETLIAMATLLGGGAADDGTGDADKPQFDDIDADIAGETEEERLARERKALIAAAAFDDDDDIDPATGLPRRKKPMSDAARRPMATRRPSQTTITHKFADYLEKVATRQLRRIKAAGQLEQRARDDRAREERIGEVRMFCDRMAISEGRMSPADNDETSHLSERSQLILLAAQPQTTHSFADPTDKTGKRKVQKTLLQLRQEAIAAREPRKFSERVKSGAAGGEGDDPFAAKVNNYYAKQMAALDKNGAGRRN